MSTVILASLFMFMAHAQGRQPPRGASPKEVLSPKMYDELSRTAGDVIYDKLQSVGSTTKQDIASIRLQHSYLVRQQEEILTELRANRANFDQLITDSEHVRGLETRLSAMEAAQRNDPSDIAILKIKVDSIANAAIWLLAGVGSLVLGCLGVLARRGITMIVRSHRSHDNG